MASSANADAMFWMGGRLATGLLEITEDLSALDRPGFWAVSVSYEGRWTCARFESVVNAPFPTSSWNPVTSEWVSSLNKEQYISYVEEIRRNIALGNVYQANACRVLSAEYVGSLRGLFSELLVKNPAPYAAYLNVPHLEIASASPELFLKKLGPTITSTPIKGTSRSAEFGEKDRAENIMIVDLMRNDLSRICRPGSVATPRLLAIEEHPGLFHLVSDISGELKDETSWTDIGSALLPAGSISGAPKSSALEIISQTEKVRGPYCGVLGYVDNSEALLSVGIRIFWRESDSHIHFGTGAGITWGSDAESEWQETELKAKRLMAIANGERI
jgi:para-aminobenzoate synthetase component 1